MTTEARQDVKMLKIQQVMLDIQLTHEKGEITLYNPIHTAEEGATVTFELSQNADVDPVYDDPDSEDPTGFIRRSIETCITVRTTFDPPQKLR